MEKSRFETIREGFVEKVTGIFMLGIGCLFFYVPLISFLENYSESKVMTESQKADIESITQNLDESAISEAVSRLMGRDDIVRIRVLKGDMQYPEFEINRGRNEKPGDIGSLVVMETNGYWIWIGYSMTDAVSAGKDREFKSTIMAIGSMLFGAVLMVFGLIQIFLPARDRLQRIEENPRTAPAAPPTPQPPEPEPVRYEGLRIVKGGK